MGLLKKGPLPAGLTAPKIKSIVDDPLPGVDYDKDDYPEALRARAPMSKANMVKGQNLFPARGAMDPERGKA